MRTLKVYLHGATMGTPPGRNTHQRAKRGNVGGWSPGATRRNVAFLRSVEPDTLHVTEHGELLYGIAFTLTVRDCPPTSDDWTRLRRAFLKRLQRAGMHRAHWVTEWQRRGVPHLHGCAWSTSPKFDIDIIRAWLDLASPYGVSPRGQHLAAITDPLGWFKYLAKHAARGVQHYQRSAENVPAGWVKTGRVWGHWGEWDTRPPIELYVSDRTFFRLRRLARSWRIADARSSGDARRIASARRMLTSHDRALSELRGVSEWIPQDTYLALLDLARGTEDVHDS